MRILAVPPSTRKNRPSQFRFSNEPDLTARISLQQIRMRIRHKRVFRHVLKCAQVTVKNMQIHNLLNEQICHDLQFLG